MSTIFSSFKKFSQYLQSSGTRSPIISGRSRSRHHICEAGRVIIMLHTYIHICICMLYKYVV